ncbi:hypothetical protein PV396_24490 [Streptomyces sp. ME02-8801-2C]|uniref:hypothetical protein n=1 Tax=Streptomyces sp. ME02-8801-2C TaxID=3028680 RepID=UPI0029A0C8E7|nr:hypothetical protein [Streptomyces sp. ME02-8801-2C]MDX3455061.1 hypothetical protein [Streptomyces sp. ME02-8801-2C]
MSRLSHAADRLATGSTLIARRLATRTAAWVARGRRTDLTGWKAALGCWARLTALLLGLYLLWRLIRAVPNLLWLLSATWTIAAWCAGKPPPKTTTDAPAAPSVEAVHTLLLDVMGSADGVHLRTVLAHLQEHGQWEGRKVADLRAHLELLGIPLDRRVKVGRIPTWGVRRRDLQTPSPPEEPQASPSPSPGT